MALVGEIAVIVGVGGSPRPQGAARLTCTLSGVQEAARIQI